MARHSGALPHREAVRSVFDPNAPGPVCQPVCVARSLRGLLLLAEGEHLAVVRRSTTIPLRAPDKAAVRVAP